MKRKAKDNFKSITKCILKILGASAGTYVLGTLAGGRGSDKLLKGLAQYSKWTILQTLRELRMRGYIEYEASDDKSPIILTENGLKRSLHYQLTDLFSSVRKKWDYLWRMVIFDIPEKKKTLREVFRRKLNTIGFYQLQKSVFVAPFKCERELVKIGELYHVLPHILVLTVASLGPREKDVRKYFFEK